MFKNKISMPVVASSGGGGGYKITKLTITENGLYDSEFEAYKPVIVNITPVSTLKTLLDATKSTYNLFLNYNGTNVDGLISYSDTANVTNMESMFESSMLTTIPQLDTSKVTDMWAMFSGCSDLTNIPELDTSNVTNMQYFVRQCSNLISIPRLDVSKCNEFSQAFESCSKLTSFGMYGFTCTINISDTALQHDALVAVLNQAGTPADSSERIIVGSAKLALLSDEEKAIATNKGWTLA